MKRDSKFTQRIFGLFWEDRLIWLCLYVMLYQWAIALVPYWYDETIAMTKLMLNTVVFAGLLFPRSLLVRIPIGLGVVLWSVYEELQQFQLWVSTDAGLSILESLLQYHPYLWLVGLIWLTYELFMSRVKTSWHIVMLLVLQFIVLGALDSFTPEILWDQVAWVMSASLVWLIALHFRTMKHKFPAQSGHTKRYAVQMTLSAIVLVSAIICSGLSMPGLAPIVTDPYTAWISNERFPVAGAGNGSGGGIGSGVSSGYSTHDYDLGGGFEMDFKSVMTVTADYRGYWRGESKAVYIGNGWADLESEDLQTAKPGTELQALNQLEPHVPTRTVKQTFTMQDSKTYPILFGVATISAFDQVKGKHSGSMKWNSHDGELIYKPGADKAYPESYTILSEVSAATPEEMRKGTVTRNFPTEGIKGALMYQYLKLPNEYPARVKSLAEQITKGATNDYDRAKFIESYLRTEFKYTNKPDIRKKVSEDFVESFLFEIEEGYCDYFSSTMAVMLRSVGIPTRWVKGYAPGTRDLMIDNRMPEAMLERMSDPNEGGTFRVTNADAHSWVEVYLGEYGWVAFEPTPGFTMPRLQAPSAAEEPELGTDLNQEEPDQQTAKSEEVSLPAWIGTLAQAVLMLAAAFAFVMMLLRWRSIGYTMRWIRFIGRRLTPREHIIADTELWLSYCHLHGMRKEKHETVREAVERWSHERTAKKQSAEQIVCLFEQAKYGHEELKVEDWQQLKAVIREFKRTGS
ncbi:transglutaminase domain-containing protein [Paenibacillus sp. ACRRX]|uniref:DUF4129 domain-containing transglutaminase family protein n=1 Tax=Paenibacillus sp. ACRRX TaxID=2918206 RepID=UPI001EF4BB98|nr:transglutaminase domain-containing protein [Paenibacillus sp. ACRRX]MCG7407905.1 transglutaminase domain-containing protein [Paenibacillus sp. ACRRX]